MKHLFVCEELILALKPCSRGRVRKFARRWPNGTKATLAVCREVWRLCARDCRWEHDVDWFVWQIVGTEAWCAFGDAANKAFGARGDKKLAEQAARALYRVLNSVARDSAEGGNR